ncbi:hypothetical protein J8I29_25480 [Labrys sp. LIt4]|uniref:hypothetical protein n=1 Tax=Labrys sp. LIt4 TaxID=2821355 RepID=UPI001ADF2795|nr:hypothetical protein [Labrys sp. LIt4]MBP0582702.1 hypothetical protein [Labrys sp. LIt4]
MPIGANFAQNAQDWSVDLQIDILADDTFARKISRKEDVDLKIDTPRFGRFSLQS